MQCDWQLRKEGNAGQKRLGVSRIKLCDEETLLCVDREKDTDLPLCGKHLTFYILLNGPQKVIVDRLIQKRD